MDANEVVAAAQEAALSSIKHATSSAAGRAEKEGGFKHDRASKSLASNSARQAVDKGEGSSNPRSASPSITDPDEGNDDESEEGANMEEGEVGEMSFVIDTAGDMDIDREIALEDETKAEHADTHVEAGLLLPSHVNLMPESDTTQPVGNSSGPLDLTPDSKDDEGDMGDFEQLDMDPSVANRYYGAEEKAERRAKEQCLACGELGHDRRHCPHQHCLACGAMDDHPTRFCPMSTSCFRCGGMGHQTRTCPKPRRGPRSEECERCGSYTHVTTLCPTLWRLYTYSTMPDFDRARDKAFFKLQKTEKRRDLDTDPAELSDSEDEFVKAGQPLLPMQSGEQFDPATRWCYNCSQAGNHWGDDCPEPRCNPTRGTGEPSAFSEFVSRLGPFGRMLPDAPPLAGFRMASSQFTFSVGSSATIHVAGDANGTSSRGTPRGPSRDPAALAIGRHTISSSRAGRAPSPPRASSSHNQEKIVTFGQTKAVEVPGGYLTRQELKKNKKPLPEHLFSQWVQDRRKHEGSQHEIRKALEKRAKLEAQGLDTSGVPTTQQIVEKETAKRDRGRKNKEAEERAERSRLGDDDDRPRKRSRKDGSVRDSANGKGETAADPIAVDSDSSFRDDFSDDSDSGGRKAKRRGDGKNNRGDKRGPMQMRSQQREGVKTGWGHHGDGGGRGSNGGGGGKGYKGGRFSSKKGGQERSGGDGGDEGGKRKRRSGTRKDGGGAGGAGGARRGGGRSNHNNSGASGSDKVRGGGSKYRGSYF